MSLKASISLAPLLFLLFLLFLRLFECASAIVGVQNSRNSKNSKALGAARVMERGDLLQPIIPRATPDSPPRSAAAPLHPSAPGPSWARAGNSPSLMCWDRVLRERPVRC